MDLTEAIVKLRLAQKRLKRLLSRLARERRRLFEEVKRALTDGDRETARRYAERVVSLMHRERTLQRLLDVLEACELRLEQKRVLSELRPVIGALDKLVSLPEEVGVEEVVAFAESLLGEGARAEESEVEKLLRLAREESIKELEEMLPSVEEAEVRE